MARLFTANTDYFVLGSALVTSVPLSMACWIYCTTLPTSHGDEYTLVQISDSSGAGKFDSWYIRIDDSSGKNRPQAIMRNGALNNALCSAEISVNTWHHICGVWAATDSGAIYLDGGNKATDSTNVTGITGLDSTQLGRVDLGTFQDDYFDGRMAEAAIWDVALTDEQVAALAAGASPMHVSPSAPVGYWPLYASQTGNAIDYSGNGNDLTEMSAIGVADHAPVAPPWGFRGLGSMSEATAPSGLDIPIAYHHYRTMH